MVGPMAAAGISRASRLEEILSDPGPQSRPWPMDWRRSPPGPLPVQRRPQAVRSTGRVTIGTPSIRSTSRPKPARPPGITPGRWRWPGRRPWHPRHPRQPEMPLPSPPRSPPRGSDAPATPSSGPGRGGPHGGDLHPIRRGSALGSPPPPRPGERRNRSSRSPQIRAKAEEEGRRSSGGAKAMLPQSRTRAPLS